jgi:RNA polymerase sigma-70 factor, ECF subfamily
MNGSESGSGANVTALLKRAAQGDPCARDELYPHVYAEMRKLAAVHLARERPGHTLQPTALLHEAYLRLIQVKEIDWISRGHFFAMSARIMRRILITHARARLADKRGGGLKRVDLDAVFEGGAEPAPLLLALDEALTCLEKESPRAYQLVELKFFAGLSFDEAALAMNVSTRTLKRDWNAAKRWLYRQLQGQEPPAGR